MMRGLVVLLILAYRWVISPLKLGLFGPTACCRFEPTCSEYALEAVGRHGVWRGVGLVLRRLSRCHPWGGCGCDPVPPESWRAGAGWRGLRADRGPEGRGRALGMEFH